MSEDLISLPAYLRRNYTIWPNRVALRQKDFGIWTPCTWKECYERTRAFAHGLLALGFNRGDRVIIIGDNEFETYWGIYGTLALGGAVVGAWVDAMMPEVEYILGDCTPRFALVRDQEQVDKFISMGNYHALQKIIFWEPRGMNESNYVSNPMLMGYEELEKLGWSHHKEHPNLFEESINQVGANDPSTLYYTSGTSGNAKGVVRTHANQIAMGKTFQKYFPVEANDNLVCIFPAASIGEPVMGSVRNLMDGTVLNFPELPDTYESDTREVGPRYYVGIPRNWEDLASKIRSRIDGSSRLTQWWFDLAVKAGQKKFQYLLERKKQPILQKLYHHVMWTLALRPNLDRAGMLKVNLATTSGFMLGSHTFRFLNACGLRLRVYYASTEAPAIAAHMQGSLKERSVGRILEDMEIRVASNQELLVRGPMVFDRYYRKPEATADALDKSGWYHSGDAGYVDENGYIFFYDRIKEMATLATGLRFSPQYIESELRFGTYLKDGWVIGENKDHVSAIVTLDMESMSRWAERNAISFTTQIELSQMDIVSEKVREDIMQVNKLLPEETRIRRYIILHKEFDADEDELTRTRKLRRGRLLERYKVLTEALYSDREHVDFDAPFRYHDGTSGSVQIRLFVRDATLSDSDRKQ